MGMSNVLKVSLQTTIYRLADRGWSQRRIANELGINRATVGRYLRLSKPSIPIAGFEQAKKQDGDLVDQKDLSPLVKLTIKLRRTTRV